MEKKNLNEIHIEKRILMLSSEWGKDYYYPADAVDRLVEAFQSAYDDMCGGGPHGQNWARARQTIGTALAEFKGGRDVTT